MRCCPFELTGGFQSISAAVSSGKIVWGPGVVNASCPSCSSASASDPSDGTASCAPPPPQPARVTAAKRAAALHHLVASSVPAYAPAPAITASRDHVSLRVMSRLHRVCGRKNGSRPFAHHAKGAAAMTSSKPLRGGAFIFLPSIAVVCSCQDGAARIAFQPRSCRAGWLNPHQARRRLRGSIPKTGWTPGRRSLLTSSATSAPFSGGALPPRPAESPPPVPGRGATSGAERAAAFAGLDTAPSRPDCDAPWAREAPSATGWRSRSTEDTWQRTTGSSCRPHESTTGDAGVSLTRSLSDSGPVPISLAVRALLHLKNYARCLHGAADIIRFARGRRASGSPPCGLRVRRRRR